MNDWVVLSSSTGFNKDGIPMGEILIQYPETDLYPMIKQLNIDEAVIKPYKDDNAIQDSPAENSTP